MSIKDEVVMKIQDPRIRNKIIFLAKGLMIIAALIAVLSVQYPGPIQLALFLLVAQTFIILGIVLYLSVAITDFLRRHGVTRMHFKRGEIIFRQGDKGDFVYTIVSGEVEVIREEPEGEKVLARMGTGQYFGEMALVSDAPRTATVRTLTEVDVIIMGRVDFTTLYAYLPDIQQSVEKVMQERRRP